MTTTNAAAPARPRGRPPTGLVKRSISFPPELLARIDAARGEEERSAFVVALVEEAIGNRGRSAPLGDKL